MKTNTKRILLAGDSILDKYVYGNANRISPEAPIQVLLANEGEKNVAGGAANVAMNIMAAGGEVDVFSSVGKDEDGDILEGIISSHGIGTSLLYRNNKPTITKLRYIGQNNQQVLRVDREDTREEPVSDFVDQIEAIKENLCQYALIVLSDYDKGFLSKSMCKTLVDLSKKAGIPVFTDVKAADLEKYKGSYLIKPNRKELSLLTGENTDSIESTLKASLKLCSICECKYVLATLGADGMMLVDKSGLIFKTSSNAKEVFDVTGAGDTALAYLAVEYANGSDIVDAVRVANIASGIQVSKLGTSLVYRNEIKGLVTDLEQIHKLKEQGKRLVFTNGCFDIIHAGHTNYLKKAKELGDILVVGVNTDDSVKRLKGNSRPINGIEDRMAVLSELKSVDFVIPFDEDTPFELINIIRPDVLVKGGDYKEDEIVGGTFVKSIGGEVVIMDYIPGKSTSALIKKISAM